MQENNGASGRIPREEFRLDLYSVLSDIKEQWIAILLLTVSAVLLSYVLLSADAKHTYTTTATVAVRYADENPDINNATGPDINSALKYAGDCAKTLATVLSNGSIRATAAKESELAGLSGSITAAAIAETNLLVIRDTSGLPAASLKETEALLNYLLKSEDQLLGGIKVTVVQQPHLRKNAVDKGKIVKQSIAMGIACLFFLCTLLGWRSSSRYTVRKSSEVKAKTGADLLAVIPREKNGKAGLLITDRSIANAFGEETRSLAARLINEMERDGRKVLLVSSAAEGEGKSTAAANIALAMSEMNRRVILADLDFRNPALAKILNMKDNESADLMQFLANGAKDTGSADLDGLIRSVPGTGLFAVLNSKAAPLAVDRYAVQIRKCLELLRDRADFVIIDTSAAKAVSDTEALASMADASVIIVRENFAEVADIEKTVTVLSKGGHMIGCVFNDARKNAISADAAQLSNGGRYAG